MHPACYVLTTLLFCILDGSRASLDWPQSARRVVWSEMNQPPRDGGFDYLTPMRIQLAEYGPELGNSPQLHEFILPAVQSLPPWPSNRDLTPLEWSAYIELAYAISQHDAISIQTSLLACESIFQETMSFREMGKLMILLRVLFDVPASVGRDAFPDVVTLHDRGLSLTPSLPCGGWEAGKPLSDGKQSERDIVSPVMWRPGQLPQLTFGRGIEYPHDQLPSAVREFRFMYHHFPFRQLEPIIESIGNTELDAASILFRMGMTDGSAW